MIQGRKRILTEFMIDSAAHFGAMRDENKRVRDQLPSGRRKVEKLGWERRSRYSGTPLNPYFL
jgi:hypothetical protein